MTTSLSSTFDIIYDGPTLVAAGANTATLSTSAIGREFAVVGMVLEGVNLSVGTLTRSITAGNVAVATATSAAPINAIITPGNVVVLPAENLVFVCSGADIDRFVITCQAAGTDIPQAVT